MEPTLSTPSQATQIIPQFTSDGRVLFGCVNCKKKLSVKRTTIGRTITCPHCKTGNQVPDPDRPGVSAEPGLVEPVGAVGPELTPGLMDGPSNPSPVPAAAVGAGAAEPAFESVLLDPAAVLKSKGIEPLAPSSVEPGSSGDPAPSGEATEPVKKFLTPQFSDDGRVIFRCSNCQKKLSVKATTIGKLINCTHCQTSNKVPDPAAKAVEGAASASGPAPAVNVVQPVAQEAPAPVPQVAPAAAVEPVLAQAAQAAGGSSPAVATGVKDKPKLDGPERFVFTCYFCSHKMSVKVTSVGKSVKCPVCHNENVVPSQQQLKGPDVVMPTREQWALANQNVATGDSVEVRVFFPCYSCHKKLSAKIDQAGQPMKCPGCSVVNVVPGLSTGLINPVDESSVMPVSNPVVFDSPAKAISPAAATDTSVAGVLAEAPVKAAESGVVADAVAGETQATPVAAPVAAAAEEAAPLKEAVAPVAQSAAEESPQAAVEPQVEPEPEVITSAAVATPPQTPAAESVSLAAQPPVEAAPSPAPAPGKTIIPTDRLEGEKPLGPGDLGDPIPLAKGDDEGDEVAEAFSLVVPEPEGEGKGVSVTASASAEAGGADSEPAPAQPAAPELQVQAPAAEPKAPAVELVQPPAPSGQPASSGDVGDFTLAPPGSVASKPKPAERPFDSLNKSAALMALAQMIPSAASKAAEITEDSTVLPPVNRPGMKSEAMIRRSGRTNDENEQDFMLPDLKPGPSDGRVTAARVDDDDVFEPIAPLDAAPVAPPKAVEVQARAVEPVKKVEPAAVVPEVKPPAPAPAPVLSAEPAAPAPSPKQPVKMEKPGPGVPAGFIAFRCQGCSKRLTVKVKHAGMDMACPVCKQMNKVPAKTPPGLLDPQPAGKRLLGTGPGPGARPAAKIAPKIAAKMPEETAGGSLMGEVMDLSSAPSAEVKKSPAAPVSAAKKPVAPQPGKPAAQAPAKPAATPAKPAAKPSAPAAKTPDPDDPFAGLAQASQANQGGTVDLSDALSALAGEKPAANDLDDLANALGPGARGDAEPDDITMALSLQSDQPDDGLVISAPAPVDEDAPIGLAEDPTPGGKAKAPAPKAAGQPAAAAQVPSAGKFIPTNKNDGKLRFPCSQCGHRLKVPPEAKGKKAKCPACGTVNNVPL